MTKLTDAELWAALDEATLDAELDAESELTPEEREQALIKAGYDIDELHAEADAFFASLPAPASAPAPASVPAPAPTPAPAPAPVPLPAPKRTRSVVLPLGLALAAGVALTLYFASLPAPVGSAPPDAPAAERAAAFRREAREACDAHRWAACLDKLDDARSLDPAGDKAPDIQALRRTASEPPPAGTRP